MATPELNPVTTMTLLGLLKQNVEYYDEGHEKQGEPVANRTNISAFTQYQNALDKVLKQYGGAANFEKSYFDAKGAEPLPKPVASIAADKRQEVLLSQNTKESRMEEARLEAEARRNAFSPFRRPPLPPRRPDSTSSFAEAGQSGRVEGSGGPFTLQEQVEPSQTSRAFSLPPRRESLSPAREPDGPEQLLSAREPDGPEQKVPFRIPPRRPENLKESSLVSIDKHGYKKYKKDSAEAQSFRDAYAAAEEGAIFDWDGREYKKY